MRLAVARVREAEAQLREASAAFFPEVTGSYGYTRTRVSTRTLPPPVTTVPFVRPQNTLMASTSFELDFWGRFARATEAAQANLLGNQLAQDVVGLTLAGSTSQAYFALRSLDAQIAVLELTIKARRVLLRWCGGALASGYLYAIRQRR